LAVPVAVPLAVDVALVVLAASTVSRPPDVTEAPSAMVASASLSAMLTPTAAATLTLPSEVLADGVGVPESAPPTPDAPPSLSAKLRCWVFWLSVLPTVLLPLS
jgi:hypothetical protein